MARRTRRSDACYAYHALDRAAGRATPLDGPADYAAFEGAPRQARGRTGVRLVAYAAMPDHWHPVVRPAHDGEPGTWARWPTGTHVRRRGHRPRLLPRPELMSLNRGWPCV